eukprot:GFUD01090554.1.p1 GENE.GFUD01090554.1~~GFUD01090554.1.p1  ORF type:complete len:103 (-),score=18.69 GFUD01090554.1:141-449(-)
MSKILVFLCVIVVQVSFSASYSVNIEIQLGGLKQIKQCDCDYHPGGCVISVAPPDGWKCFCQYKGAWTCSAYAQQCNTRETCPGECYSKECCERGGGDCGGY